MSHHGLFSTAYVALVLDHLRTAVHHTAEQSAALLAHLLEPEYAGLVSPTVPTGAPG